MSLKNTFWAAAIALSISGIAFSNLQVSAAGIVAALIYIGLVIEEGQSKN